LEIEFAGHRVKDWAESPHFFDADNVPATTIEASGSGMTELTREQYLHWGPKKPTI
jgi:hypothetical protein